MNEINTQHTMNKMFKFLFQPTSQLLVLELGGGGGGRGGYLDKRLGIPPIFNVVKEVNVYSRNYILL